jgi:transcriptional regulator NrdR family protein
MTARCACGAGSKVMDMRPTPAGIPRRRRECLLCGNRWTTVEVAVDDWAAVDGDYLNKVARDFEVATRKIQSLINGMHPQPYKTAYKAKRKTD